VRKFFKKTGLPSVQGWVFLFSLVVACAFIVVFTFTQLSVLHDRLETLFVGGFLLLSFAVVLAITKLVRWEFENLVKKSLVLEKIIEVLDEENSKLKAGKESTKESDALVDNLEEVVNESTENGLLSSDNRIL
jgi:hypothetical protein